jgi:hypothetical protein
MSAVKERKFTVKTTNAILEVICYTVEQIMSVVEKTSFTVK